MSRSAASPRILQLYSPRRPSPLGLPPHTVFHDVPCSAYPKTPEIYYIQQSEITGHMRFPPEARRPLAGDTQRARPAPLSLDTQHHPAAVPLPSTGNGQTLQPHGTQEMRVPPSPTSSSTSSLSLYSSDSAKRSLSIGVIQEEGEQEEKRKGGSFCLCFNFSALFGVKSKPNKSLAAQDQVIAAEPAPAPRMVQVRRRPPSLVLVR